MARKSAAVASNIIRQRRENTYALITHVPTEERVDQFTPLGQLRARRGPAWRAVGAPIGNVGKRIDASSTPVKGESL